MLDFIAPAGTPVRLTDIARGVARSFRHPTDASLAGQVSSLSAAVNCYPVSSGRAAMTLILDAMRSATACASRDEVIIPAYTCYSVPASIERAGLRPRLCDVDPSTMAMCPEALSRADFSRVLAIVSANLYGIPDPLDQYEIIARRNGVFFLDDAAQALGARLLDRAVGTFGDAGLYSFDKGKVISTVQGGVIVATGGPLARTIEARVADLPASRLLDTAANLAKLSIYAVGLRPVAYGLVRRLPFLGLGKTVYDLDYPIAALSTPQQGVASVLLERLDELMLTRRRNVEAMMAALGRLRHVHLPEIAGGSRPAFVRLPVRISNPGLRSSALREFETAGIGATLSYPEALIDVPEVAGRLRQPVEPMPGAQALARQILTLPTHSYCRPGMALEVRETLARAAVAAGIAA